MRLLNPMMVASLVGCVFTLNCGGGSSGADGGPGDAGADAGSDAGTPGLGTNTGVTQACETCLTAATTSECST